MTKFKKVRLEIIKELVDINFEGDMSDIGNAIGMAIKETVLEKDASKEGYSMTDLLHGINHGITVGKH